MPRVRYPRLRRTLMRMGEEDQRIRWSGTPDQRIDRRHADRLEAIIAAIGWPTIRKVGRRASRMAWLLAQHADHDRRFQRRCLALLKRQATSDIEVSQVAYLEDRLAVAENRP